MFIYDKILGEDNFQYVWKLRKIKAAKILKENHYISHT